MLALRRSIQCVGLFLIATAPALSQSVAPTYKLLPPRGIDLPADVIANLQFKVDQLQTKLDSASNHSNDSDHWAPNIRVLIRAV
ncbi:MAG: hypothetical protein AAGJ83_07910 [Planctomycetota bacterium]